MQEIDPKVVAALNKPDGTEKLNVDKLVKFGVVEKEVEPIPGWKVTMHALLQEENEKMSQALPEAADASIQARMSLMKRPTLIWAITRINEESFETEEQKKLLSDKLRKTPSTAVDLLYIEYQKIYVEQFDLLTSGIKKKIIKKPESRALWRICQAFHVLPTDPLFRSLNPLQISWIIDNMVQDSKDQMAAMKGKSGYADETSHSFSMTAPK